MTGPVMGQRFTLRDPSGGPVSASVCALVVRPDVGDGALWITWVVSGWERHGVASFMDGKTVVPFMDGKITALPVRHPDAHWRIVGRGVVLRVPVDEFERAMVPETDRGAT